MLIKRELFDSVRGLRGDVGARPVLERAGTLDVEAAHLCDPLDVDTREDLEALAG